jgi:hypothetical protein
VQDVGLLERHRTPDPRRRADRDVRLEVAHHPGADGGGVQIGDARDDAGRRRQAEPVADGADHRADGHQRWELRCVEPGEADEVDVVAQPGHVAVVGQERATHRRVRRRGHAGEAHRDVVDGLEVPARGAVHLWSMVLQVQHVAHRVTPVCRRHARRRPHPAQRCERLVAGDRTGDHPRALRCPLAVEPDQDVADGRTGLVDRDRRRPHPRRAQRGDGRGIDGAQSARQRGRDEAPPLVGILRRLTAGTEGGDGLVVLAPHRLAGEGDDADLQPGRALVDRDGVTY